MDAISRIVEGVKSFAQEMHDQGIHVGLGREPRCVVDGEPWPCSHERDRRSQS